MHPASQGLDTSGLRHIGRQLRAARQILLIGIGEGSACAEYLCRRLAEASIASTIAAATDIARQEQSAAALGSGDVAIVIAPQGRVGEAAFALSLAVASGATIIAMAPRHCALARRFALALTFVPTTPGKAERLRSLADQLYACLGSA